MVKKSNPPPHPSQTGIDQVSFWRSLLPNPSEKGWTTAALLVTLIGAILRILYLQQPAGNDEAYTYLAFSSQPLFTILTDYSHPNNHILHSILAHGSATLFGQVTWVIRLPALVAGILMIPISYLAGRRLYNAPAGLIGASFLAASPTFLTYSAQARGYTLLALFCLIMIWLGSELIHRNDKAGWFVFGLCGVLGAYTIPIMLYPLAAIYIWLTLEQVVRHGLAVEFRQRMMPILFSAMLVVGGTILVYSPVILAGTGWRSIVANGEVVSQPWGEFIINLQTRLGRTWREWNDTLPFLFSLLTLAGFALSLPLHRKLSSTKIHLALASLVGFAIVLLIHRVAPYTRIWTFAQPWFYIWAGAGLAGLVQLLFGRRNFAFILVTAAITIYLILSTAVDIQRNRWVEISQPGVEETVSEYLLDNQPADQLVAAVVPASTQIKFYYSQKANYKDRFYDTARQQSFNQLLVVVDTKDGHSIESVLERNKLLGQVDWLNAEPVYEYKRITIYKVNRIMEVP
jgi:uncharacterized membrane protein